MFRITSKEAGFLLLGSEEIKKIKNQIIYAFDIYKNDKNERNVVDADFDYTIEESLIVTTEQETPVCSYCILISCTENNKKSLVWLKNRVFLKKEDIDENAEKLILWNYLMTELLISGFYTIKTEIQKRDFNENSEKLFGDFKRQPLQLIADLDITNQLTKREQIAAMALQGLLANSSIKDVMNTNATDWIAMQALNFTDELLKQLNQKSN